MNEPPKLGLNPIPIQPLTGIIYILIQTGFKKTGLLQQLPGKATFSRPEGGKKNLGIGADQNRPNFRERLTFTLLMRPAGVFIRSRSGVYR